MTGSVRPLIGAMSLLLTVLCLVLAWVSGVANGVLLLATVFAVVWVWSIGGFTAAFWNR